MGSTTINKLMQDPTISEIMIDGPSLVRIEKNGEVLDTNVRFKSPQDLERLLDRLHGNTLPATEPTRDSRLEGGTRVISISGPAAVGGPFALIIKPRAKPVTWAMMEEWRFLASPGAQLIRKIVSTGHSLLISGTAGSGLTTSTILFASAIEPIKRVIVVEGRWPLEVRHPHAMVLLAKSDKRPMVTAALNLRADTIVHGEIDGAEAFELVRATQESTQVLAQIRASGVADALRRIELFCLQANVAWSMTDHRAQIANSFRFVTFQERLPGTSRRVIREITEVTGFENGHYQLEPLIRWNESTDSFDLTAHGKKMLASPIR